MEIQLSTEQLDILDKIDSNRDINYFITGKAGTGKSVLLRALKKSLESKSKSHAILAPTGVAAINVGGITIHKFIQTLSNINDFGPKQLDMVIIDEISMVRCDLLDKLNQALMYYTGRYIPFGGVQMVFIGDLSQLPPVIRRDSDEYLYIRDNYLSEYFFSAVSYSLAKFEMLELTNIFRQSGESSETYIKLLNLIRNGENEKTVKYLNEACVTDAPKGVLLCGSNSKVDEINSIMLADLPEQTYTSHGEILGSFDENELPVQLSLDLKIGAVIMVVKNIYEVYDEETNCDVSSNMILVNGDRGTITDINTDANGNLLDVEILCDRTGTYHIIHRTKWTKEAIIYNESTKDLSSTIVGSYVQFPIKLAWACTIHRTQGCTFHEYTIDLTSKMFANGQLYVALSRGTNIEGLHIMGRVRKSDVKVCSIAKGFMEGSLEYVGIKKGGVYDK